MKKFNFKKFGVSVLSFVLVSTVFLSCFVISVSAATPMDDYDLSIYTDSFAAFGVNNAKNSFYDTGIQLIPPEPPYLDFTPSVFTYRFGQLQDLGYNGASSYFYLPKVDTNKWSGRIWFSRTNSNPYNDSAAWNNSYLLDKQKLLFTVAKGYTVKALFVFFMPHIRDNELIANNFSIDFYDEDYSLGVNSNFVVKGVYSTQWQAPQPWDNSTVGPTYTGQWVVLECTYVAEERQSISSIHFTFQNFSSNVGGFLFDDFMMFLAFSPDGTWGATQQIIQNTGNWFTDLFNNLTNFFTVSLPGFFSNLWLNISSAFTTLGDRIAGFYLDITGYLGTIIGSIQDGFTRIVNNITSPFLSAILSIGNVVDTAVNIFTSFVGGLWQWGGFS